MNRIFSIIILVDCVISAYWGIISTLKKDRIRRLKFAFFFVAIFSSIWSLGFGLLYVAQSLDMAFHYREIGMVGVFGFLICAVGLIAWMAGIPRKIANLISALSFIGVPICILTCLPGQAKFYWENGEIRYSLNQTWINNLYTFFSIALCLIILSYTIYMKKKAESRRHNVFANKIFVMLFVMVFGMIIDTILPMFGFDALPGSTIGQFFALCLLRHAIIRLEQTNITIILSHKMI